jgi:hypothetical protein
MFIAYEVVGSLYILAVDQAIEVRRRQSCRESDVESLLYAGGGLSLLVNMISGCDM